MRPPDNTRPVPPGAWALAALVFCLVATMNTGGYRFGVADQAFYLPAIQRHLVPDSFPRDRIIIDEQDRLNVFTGAMATLIRTLAITPETLFVVIYVVTLVLLWGGAMAVGRTLGLSAWALAALAAALTLRHRVSITGVNTLEGYMHPRMLAFAFGLWAVAAILRGRVWLALAIVGAACVIHPTTALWLGVWIGTTALLIRGPHRRVVSGLALAAGALAAWVIAFGPLSRQLVRMDDEWLGVLAGKDYLFPGQWPASGWLLVLVYAASVVGPFLWRRHTAATATREPALIGGLAALAAIFVLSLPASAASIALAAQFQVPRVLWMLDFLGTVYVVWLIVDVWAVRPTSPERARRRRRWAASLLVVAALARGNYVTWVEHPERSFTHLGLPRDDWQDAMAWLARTPLDTHVLAHPGHAWRYGTSVRVAAGRDVFLEEVKDTAMSMYSRRVAMRVLERIRAGGDADRWTDEVRALATRYDLDYLVSERPFELPVAYRNARFTVYQLGVTPR
jgi:hypothetical protein